MPKKDAAARRLVVLCYHNVARTWSLPGAPGDGAAEFAKQLAALRRFTNVVPLQKALSDLDAGRALPRRAVAITFDDGYRDNLKVACPILAQMAFPATFFLVPGFLSGQVPAWWERLAWAIKNASVPSVRFAYAEYPLSTATERAVASASIEESAKRLTHADRLEAVEKLVAETAPSGSCSMEELFLNWDDAKRLAQDDLFSIGSHTMEHAILSREDDRDQAASLAGSRTQLEHNLDIAVSTLAYPNGAREDYDDTTMRLAREAGYSRALTVHGGAVSCGTDEYEISRRVVSTNVHPARLVAAVLRKHYSEPG